jgi:poly(A) polymerase
MATEILVVSQERIAQELKKMLVHPRRARALALAHDLKLLTVILQELAPVIATAGLAAPADRWHATLRMLEMLDSPRFELALAATLHELAFDAPAETAAHIAERICRRLRLSNNECADVAWFVGHRDALQGAAGFAKHKLKRLLSEELIGELLALDRAWAQARGTAHDDVQFCQDYLHARPAADINPPELINGDDLRKLGLAPGPQFKDLLETVRDAQLDGRISTRHEALDYVGMLVNKPGFPG